MKWPSQDDFGGEILTLLTAQRTSYNNRMEWEFLYTRGHTTTTKFAGDDELLPVGRSLEHLISMDGKGTNVSVAQHKNTVGRASILECGQDIAQEDRHSRQSPNLTAD